MAVHSRGRRMLSQHAVSAGRAQLLWSVQARPVTRRPTAGACMQVLYEQYKRLFNGEYFGGSVRALSNPETLAIGALAGASASFITTPADVVKSRLMTAAAGSSTSTATIIVELISKEGVWALFKARPRLLRSSGICCLLASRPLRL